MYKFSKCLVALVLAACMFLSCTVLTSATAGDALSVEVESVEANAGDTVDVDVLITSNPGVTVLRLFVEYDAEVLTLVGVSDAQLLSEGLLSDNYASHYKLSWFDALATEDVTATGVIATLTFKVADGASEGDSAVKVYTENANDVLNAGLEQVALNVTDGKVTVIAEEAVTVGDVNGDGTVTANDAIRVLYYYLHGAEAYPVNQECDFNSDGEVTEGDAIYLLYHVLYGEDYPLN